MPRTSWQDLLDEAAPERTESTPASENADAPAPALSLPAPGNEPLSALSGEGGDALPSSLEEIPELRELLAERDRLEQTLRRLTGQDQGPVDEREVRRFPMESSSSEDGMNLSDFDEARARRRARPLEVDSAERNGGDDARVERARRRRQAASQRAARAEEEWAAHRESQLARRDRLREEARVGRLLPEPGRDVLARVRRKAEQVGSLLDRVEKVRDEERVRRKVEQVGSLLDRVEKMRDELTGSSRRRDDDSAWSRLRDAAREARRFVDDPLASTSAGRKLNRLREELQPPDLRSLPDRTGEGDVDLMDLRRARALESLKRRRAEETSRPDRRAADPTVD